MSTVRPLSRIAFFAGTLAVGLVAGTWVGVWWSGRIISPKMMYAKPALDQAILAAQEVEWAAKLRLDGAESTIRDLEHLISIRLANIAAWETVAPADERIREERDRFLKEVKVYDLSFPIAGSDTGAVEALLDTVPGRSPTAICKSGVCRLDDLRISRLNTTSNPL